MGSSYKRYRQYRANQHQYKVDQIVAPITMMIILGIITEYGRVIVIGILGFLILHCIEKCKKKKNVKEQHSMCAVDKIMEQKENMSLQEEETEVMKTTETGYINKNNQRNNGKTDIPGTDYGQWFYDMECLECGHKYHANGSNIYEVKCPDCQKRREVKRDVVTKNSTESGFVNKNNQRNNGRTDKPGTGNGQWFYDMECLKCGHTYYANGHDIWLRKCPKCQGGRP